jgi:hypothetical protein
VLNVNVSVVMQGCTVLFLAAHTWAHALFWDRTIFRCRGVHGDWCFVASASQPRTGLVSLKPQGPGPGLPLRRKFTYLYCRLAKPKIHVQYRLHSSRVFSPCQPIDPNWAQRRRGSYTAQLELEVVTSLSESPGSWELIVPIVEDVMCSIESAPR